jgi:hypothetical protein
VADFLPEEEDAEGLLKTAQGDVEGMQIFGFRKIPMICSGVNRFLLISRPSFDPLL